MLLPDHPITNTIRKQQEATGMKFNKIDHYDHFETETIFLAEISDLPEDIQEQARAIDGEEYDPECFGLCVYYNMATKTQGIVTETDLYTDEKQNIFYVDRCGDKHWLNTVLTEEFTRQIFEACDRITNGKDLLDGYQVKDTRIFEDGHGIVLAENPNAPKAYATWMFVPDNYGRRHYEKGSYFKDKDSATRDFALRADNYCLIQHS